MKKSNEKPPKDEYKKRKNKLSKMKLLDQEILDIMGSENDPFTREEMTSKLIVWIKESHFPRYRILNAVIPAYTTSLGKTIYSGIQSASKGVKNILK